VSALFPCRHSAASPLSARAFPGSAVVSGVSIGCIAYLECDFASKRGAAYVQKAGRAIRRGVQEPTDRGPDKRPQGAALSVGCFCWDLSLIRQCAALGRKVRLTRNALPELTIPHIAGAGDG
jgi:hypothetical protein